MSIMSEKIKSLNQVVAIIDSKAAAYKRDRHHMPRSRAIVEKKLILNLIKEGEGLADSIIPRPVDLLNDLVRLRREFMKY